MSIKSILGITIWPGGHPCMTNLPVDPAFLNYAVSLDSTVPGKAVLLKLSNTVAILYNSEALLSGCRGNRRIGNRLFAGVIYIVGIKDGNLSDLSFQDMDRYYGRFWEPETYTEADVTQAWIEEWNHLVADLD